MNTHVKCCGALHKIVEWTTKGPTPYGAECSICGRRIEALTPEALMDEFAKANDSFPDWAVSGLRSRCCGDLVKVRGRTTHWYECDECGLPCDVKVRP